MASQLPCPPPREQSKPQEPRQISLLPPSQTPQKRRTLSLRAVNARRDLLKVHDLILLGKKQCEIAAMLGKDAAWVSRTVRSIHQDPALIYSAPDTQSAVSEQLAGHEALIRMAMEHAGKSDGGNKTAALRLVADMHQRRGEFLEKVGILCPPTPEGEKHLSQRDAFYLEMQQDFTREQLIEIITEHQEEMDRKAKGISLFPNRDDDRGALPFHLRKGAARFARARLPDTRA